MYGQLIILVVALAGVIAGRPVGPGAAAAVQKPVLWVLSIGVSHYQDNALDLRFADDDAKAVAAAFEMQRGGNVYRETKTLTLTNEQVTRDSILNSMSRFLGQAGPEDIVVIFIAGHGVQDRNSGSYYFLPATATKDNHITAGVRMSDFDEMLRVVRQSVRAVVLMLDTCHAGALRIGAPGLTTMDDPAARLTASEGFFLLAATKPGEEAREYAALHHGAFTYGLLEGLQGKADADGDGVVSVSELFGYVTRAVAEITSETQHPYSKIEGTDLRLVAVRPGATVLPRPTLVRAEEPAAAVVPNTIAVMEFSNVRVDTDHDWVGAALRVAFNTELSKVRALNVYAPEMIDRQIKTRGVDQLSAAQQLQIDRLVTGSFSVVGTAIRIDAHIVYAASGLQEGSDSVQGEVNDFFDLQKRLVLSMLRRLHVNPSPEEGQSIGKKSNSDVDAYRLLLESEDVVDAPAVKSAPTPRATKVPRRRSALDQPFGELASWLVGTARADDTATGESEVRDLLESYRTALEARDLDRLATLYVDFSARRRETLRQYFDSSRNLKVEISDVKITAQGDDYVVSYTRRDSFIDDKSGKPVELEVRLTRAVVRRGDSWRIAGKP